MKTGMLALALGLLTLRWLPALPPGAVLLAMLVLALMLLPFRSYPLAFFLVGLSWACFSAQRALDDRLQPALDGQTRWVEGRIVGLPQQTGTGVRFELADGRSRKGRLPKRIRVSWHGGPVVNSGERWRLALTLKRPAGLLNFHGVNHEAWLLAQRIGATATVKDGERLAPARNAWRDAVRQRLMAVDAQGREAGLAALVLGDGSGLAPEDWQVLQDTGTVHLLVISGQHIGLLAGLIYGLVAVLARYGCWPRTWPWLPWACGLAFGAALGYGLLAGFGVPVQRACVMVGLVLLWRLRFRHLGLWWPLLLALNGVLVLEPLASLQVGFWLSFAAVAVLLLAFGGRLGPWSVWQAWTRPQWLIAIGLFPVLLVLGWPILLMAVFPPREWVPHGQVEVLQLDVGQGQALILRTRHHTLLYDAGPRSGPVDLGARVVLPSLKKLGVGQLDMMLLSHADADHAGGAAAVARGLPVKRVVGGETEGLPAFLATQPCSSGERWEWDGVWFELWQWAGGLEGNPRSCVLHVQANGERLLLTGDIDRAAEQAFLASPLAVPTDWLQAPHHGSRSSSSWPFVQRLAPTSVLISRGRSNTFGHPHPQVLERYQALGSRVYDSAEQGAVRLRLGAFVPATVARSQRRFWREPLP